MELPQDVFQFLRHRQPQVHRLLHQTHALIGDIKENNHVKLPDIFLYGSEAVCVYRQSLGLSDTSMRNLSHCFIVGHVHDELIIECRPEVSLDAVCAQMSRSPG